MVIKVISKTEPQKQITSAQPRQLRIPAITGAQKPTQNIIMRAIKIMLMDIRMLLHPKQTREELEKYSQFADFVYGRK